MLSERLFFITERITDILKPVGERTNLLPTSLNSIRELNRQLSWFVDYLRRKEGGDEQQQQHDHDRFFLELHSIANSSDDILNQVISDDVTCEIYDIVYKIRKSHNLLSSESNYSFHSGRNVNMSGRQNAGNMNIYIGTSHSRAPVMTRSAPRPKSYGHDPIHGFVGFNHEIETLLHHLTQDNEFCVVGIVGMGGSGKTTLAKHIYNLPKIKTHFTHKIWVCISQSWDETKFLDEIWGQVATDPNATEMHYSHQLYDLLNSESYLIILDDVWCINSWHHISPGLPQNKESKVVVTTHIKTLPKHINLFAHIVEPTPLDGEDSWKLFKKEAFLPKENISDELLQLGEEMVKKCNGLPLAIVALAGVLGMNKSENSWQGVSKTLIHKILNANNHLTHGVVKEILAMSYNELPHHLKQCVLYLRHFPVDYEINARSLMQMWIAEGFVSTKKHQEFKAQEFKAQEYLDKMIDQFLVKVVKKKKFMGQVSRIRIHDLIRQILVDIDEERHSFPGDSLRLDSSAILYGHEQFCNSSSMSPSKCIADIKRDFSYTRSVICLNNLNLLKSVLPSLFKKFRFLRILILHESCMLGIEIPEEIGNLIHLRYIELGGGIEQLPGSIGKLRNLQTLNMRYLTWKTRAEINLCELKELRHLYLPDNVLAEINMEELKLERLEKLKTLWNARGGKWMLLGMERLSAVLEELRVHVISSEEQLEAVFRTPSITLNNLQTLELDWNGSGNGNVKLRNMSILRECKSLKKLKLCGEIQASTSITFPPKLIKLEMRHTCLEDGQVMNIISESCPYLEILKFCIMDFRGEELVCNANSFGKLVKLTLDNLKNLKMWKIESSAMPSLHYLTIREYEHLDLNPEGWTRILKVPQLTHTKDGNVPVRNFKRKKVV